MSAALASNIVEQLENLAGARPRVLVAFSGGIDSTVLAHALVKSRRKLGGLRLVHVDHGLQAASADWSRQCARQARAWRVPFVAVQAHIERQRGDSPEAAAREARYALLAGVMQPDEVLVTAQHRDDQVETLLLQLFRGAGVAGLAAMPAIARFGPGHIARPLLEWSRAELERYAQHHGLRWVDDPSNEQLRFDRNYLRHRVLPAVRARWRGVDAAIARSARHMSSAAKLLDEVAIRDLARVADGADLDVAALRTLPATRRRNVLRAFIARAGIELPSSARLHEISDILLRARTDAQPHVAWPGGVMRRRGDRLQLEAASGQPGQPASQSALKSWNWQHEREYIVNGTGDSLTLIDDDAGPIDLDHLPTLIEVRARAGGEKLRPGARARTQALKKLIQAAKLTVEERARLPLLFSGEGPKGGLIAAGDRWVDASVAANDKSRRRARLIWTRAR